MERQEGMGKGMKIRQATKGMGNDYQRREEWRQRYDWSKGQARGG